MNKTISVNIGGRIFNIEEAAYEKLNNYIGTIRRYFGKEDSADEIIADIELRLAELFMERTGVTKQVITMADVEEVIGIMGRPEEFAGAEDEEEAQSYRSGEQQGRNSKRVFRDPDNNVIFGVCGGVSAYFGWDPIVLRILFAIMFIFFGSGLLLYILLAIIIPKAKTTAEKLQMRGEPVTVETISKKVSESFNDMKDDLRDFGKKNDINEERIKTEGERVGSLISKFFGFIFNILSLLISFIARLIGVVLLVAASFAIVVLVGVFAGWDFALEIYNGTMLMDHPLQWLGDSIFTDKVYRQMFVWSLAALLIIPFISLMLLAARLTFAYPKTPTYVSVPLTVLWFMALAVISVTAFKASREFNVETSYKEEIAIFHSSGDMVVVQAMEAAEPKYRFRIGYGSDNNFFRENVTFPGLDSTEIMYRGKAQLTIVMNSTDDNFKLELERKARGASQKDAIQSAEAIHIHHHSSGDSLSIYPWYAIEQGQKIRNQKAKFILHVPIGKKVHFTPSSKEVIHDIPNITNTLDSEMIDEIWIMTRNGLACESCIDSDPSTTRRKSVPIEREITPQ